MNTLKRATALLAALLGFATTQALAGNAVKLSDAELDNVTAGSAMVVTVVYNPGQASVQHVNDTFTNVHVVGLPEGVENPFDGGKARIIMVTNPARIVFKCAGSINGVSICQ